MAVDSVEEARSQPSSIFGYRRQYLTNPAFRQRLLLQLRATVLEVAPDEEGKEATAPDVTREESSAPTR